MTQDRKIKHAINLLDLVDDLLQEVEHDKQFSKEADMIDTQRMNIRKIMNKLLEVGE